MLLTREQILFLLDLLKYETVAEVDRVRVSRRVDGYREGEPGRIQAYLSIVLEAKAHLSEGDVKG